MTQNEISVSAFNLEETEESVNVFVLVRNVFVEEITISNLPLQLFDASGDLVAQLGFPLDQFVVASHEARPINLSFQRNVFKKNLLTLRTGTSS